MNELDYVRDNRLRLWFLKRELPIHKDIPKGRREETFRALIEKTFTRIAPQLPRNGVVALVIGETSRGGAVLDSSSIIRSVFKESALLRALELEREIHDMIPDIRRSRRDLQGTKRETVLVFRKWR